MFQPNTCVDPFENFLKKNNERDKHMLKTQNSQSKLLQIIALGIISVAALLSFSTQAQPVKWPEKAVRIVVPAPPGSAPDALVRMFAQKMSESWGQSVTVENVVGASGNIGTDRVAKALPDGYTLFLASNSFSFISKISVYNNNNSLCLF